jgi:type IV pilus assembly protein PilB
MSTAGESGSKKAGDKPAADTKPGASEAAKDTRVTGAAGQGATKPASAESGTKPAAPGVTKPAATSSQGATKPAAAQGATKPAAGKAPAAPAKPAPKAGGDGAATPAPGAAPKPAAAKPEAAAAKPDGEGADQPPEGAKHPPRPKPHIGNFQPAQGGERKIGQVLVDLGFIDEDQLWEILDESKNTGVQLGQAALSRGLITEEQLFQALAERHGLKIANLEELKPQAEAMAIVPETMASVYKVMPVTVQQGVLTVVIGDPASLAGLDDLRNFLGVKEVHALLAPPKLLEEATQKAYTDKPDETILDIIQEMETDKRLSSRSMGGRGETSIDLESLMEIQDAAPVRKLLNMVMLLAIKDRASDIHFEPFEDEYKLRYRCDGVMMELVPPPRHLATAISSRIKVMANLDIAERRLPQDGRIELNVGGNPVDMRVSVLPTMFGESVVIRVLDRTVVHLDLNRIGMQADILKPFRELIHKPNGIVLVTGPTGCGKTTTLYSALNELNEVTDKIITTEDPVEYEIDGIIQVPINSDIGVTFANSLRAILRQDPDKILVGEVRDLETAQIAVQASLTGHMVFSTLHTNDAPSSITRMRDMGVEPFLITATVEGILAQRLVRKICEDCRTEFEPSVDMLMELNLRPDEARGKKFYYGRGCPRCNNTGHRGRCGIYELLIMNDEIRDLISQGASTDQLRKACISQGMSTLRDAGLNAVFSGVTSIEEVARETVVEDD